MQAVAVESKLYRRVEEVALEQGSSINDLLAQSLRYYLWELDRRKVSAETRVYHQRHEELKAQYLGQYIAMRNGQVVDQDRDFRALRQRVRKHFGQKPVMITLVEDAYEHPLTRRGFRAGEE
ncbi:MAG: hypothetical protein KJ638_10205 [Chloroflexi bacterium]|nr:hypothetical protein [Chloroflexota bacterium]